MQLNCTPWMQNLRFLIFLFHLITLLNAAMEKSNQSVSVTEFTNKQKQCPRVGFDHCIDELWRI
ncbi:hypothetical protein T07_5439 [Trichinella nelsoni]|uniref:Uncharacterized protein n=1 Tax=Trichinella nelsoni TaxID=6336 RepID=A0A0V0RVU9_9BILA|nr:hypothetical protein T07_5439 [Trichinella nelsoni]